MAGAKTISTLEDAFILTHHKLLKLKKYEGLVYNDEHAIAEINKITDTSTNTKAGNRPKTPGKDVKIKASKIMPSGATAGSVENLATQ